MLIQGLSNILSNANPINRFDLVLGLKKNSNSL